MIKVFCDRQGKKLNNFWNHVVFHPTDAIEDDWGQVFLDKIAEDKAAITIRMYSMFEESVTLDEKGEMQFDFSANDYRIDSLLEKGFEIFITYGFIPPWLAVNQDPELQKKRYKGKILSRSYPSDYKKWGEIYRVYTKHLVDRYGEDKVRSWRLNCYNEPDLWTFFYQDAPDWKAVAEEYCKLYDAFAEGICAVSDRFQIGGCSLSHSQHHIEFLEYFLNHVKACGTKLDFISAHNYGTSYRLMNEKKVPIYTDGPLESLLADRRVVELCGFGDLPYVVDEWGAATDGYYGIKECEDFEFREDEKYAAYFAKMITSFEESNVPVEQMMLCLSGQHNLICDFGGHRNFFSKSFYPKPIYNAFVLAGKLGSVKLPFYSDLHWNLSTLPTGHEDGHISILLSYADPGLRLELPTQEVEVVFEGLIGAYKAVTYTIDKTHANAYTRFLELGSPQDASEEIKQEIRRAGALTAEEIGVVTQEDNKVVFTMENRAVVLLEVYPTKKEC